MFLESFWRGAKYGLLGLALGFVIGCVAIPFNTNVAAWLFCGGSFVLIVAGVLFGFITGFKTVEQRQERAYWAVKKECSRSEWELRILDEEVIQVSDRKVTSGEKISEALSARFGGGKARIDSVQAIRIGCPEGDFYLVIPWSGYDMMAHEFVSLERGYLPCALGLARSEFFGLSMGGVWIGPNGHENHPIAKEADRHGRREGTVSLDEGIEWDWFKGNLKSKLKWGLQAIPAAADSYLHLMHTAQIGIFRKRFGLDWYLRRRAAFADFVSRLRLNMEQDRHFLFPCSSLEIVDAMKWDDPSQLEHAEQVLPVQPVNEAIQVKPIEATPPPASSASHHVQSVDAGQTPSQGRNDEDEEPPMVIPVNK